MDIFNNDSRYIANTYKRFPLEIAKGRGSIVIGGDGRRYIDMGSGIAVNGLGVCDPQWKRAVKKQLGELTHCSNLYYSRPQTELAELLCERTGMKKVFFANSGAEANEAAIKVARKYSFDKYGAGRAKIVTLKNSFHGRTVTTLSATGQDVFHNYFFPFTEGFDYAVANDAADTALKMDGSCCALMIELIQGEGGMNVLSRDYVLEMAELCAQKDILLIVDEVQTGNGRTGELFCWEHYGIMPDIATTAKGLGGGLPIGAALLGEKVENTLGAGSHGSTFGGNPVCAAGALSVLRRIDRAFLDEVSKKGDYLKGRFEGADGVEEVTGMGLMIGILPSRVTAAQTAAKCLENGVLVLTAKDKVRLLPALNIPDKLLERAADIILAALK